MAENYVQVQLKLKEAEKEWLDEVAEELEMSPTGTAIFAVRAFLEKHGAKDLPDRRYMRPA